jgi:hypothetical protein
LESGSETRSEPCRQKAEDSPASIRTRFARRLGYTASAPQLVSDYSPNLGDLITTILRDIGNDGCAIIGFDFPIGIPEAYARAAGITDFKSFLRQLGDGDWADFYNVCSSRNDISIHRPFYPFCCRKKGDAIRDHLAERLGIAFNDLYRRCERAHAGRDAASPLFWTLGAKQVGKAAIVGWRDVIAPALGRKVNGVILWPFDGAVNDALKPRKAVIVETYPAEYYGWFFSDHWKGKYDLDERKKIAPKLFAAAEQANITCESSLEQAIDSGFANDDAFDAIVGLFGIITVLCRFHPADASTHSSVEGWIFGQHDGSVA